MDVHVHHTVAQALDVVVYPFFSLSRSVPICVDGISS